MRRDSVQIRTNTKRTSPRGVRRRALKNHTLRTNDISNKKNATRSITNASMQRGGKMTRGGTEETGGHELLFLAPSIRAFTSHRRPWRCPRSCVVDQSDFMKHTAYISLFQFAVDTPLVQRDTDIPSFRLVHSAILFLIVQPILVIQRGPRTGGP